MVVGWKSQSSSITEYTNHVSLHLPLGEDWQIVAGKALQFSTHGPTYDQQRYPLHVTLTLESSRRRQLGAASLCS